MRDTLLDANFPRTADLRVYHLGLRPGEIANRIITVGTPSRARVIAQFLDKAPKPFELYSERGFLTITGRYNGVPISIVSIGMGSPNMDFFVREVRECLRGDMVVVRFGSCGALIEVPVGSVVVPKACVAIQRNVDFDFASWEVDEESAYQISKPVAADPILQEKLVQSLGKAKPADWPTPILPGIVNASADSFYSSQGRQTSFPDHNTNLIERLQGLTPDLATLEMETFHLYHLAACWAARKPNPNKDAQPPLTTRPVQPEMSSASSSATLASEKSGAEPSLNTPGSAIRAAGVQMVFAARLSKNFITPAKVDELEHWVGKGVLDALADFEIPPERTEEDKGSVWDFV